MKISFFIRDIDSGKFYWIYHGSMGFTREFNDAKSYKTEDDAIKELNYLKNNGYDLIDDIAIEIVKVYYF